MSTAKCVSFPGFGLGLPFVGGVLGDQLLTLAYAQRKLDVAGAWETLPHLAAAARENQPGKAAPRTAAHSQRHRIGDLPYAVIDTETTGLDPLRDRIIEIAIIILNPDGTTSRSPPPCYKAMASPARATSTASSPQIWLELRTSARSPATSPASSTAR
jgi:hypothetical protein